MKKVAIITLNYNGQKDTLELLSSLEKLSVSDYEVLTIVVDNASIDDSVKRINEEFPQVDIVQSGGNLGFSGGFNKGIIYAQAWGADYFLLINNDCLIKSPDLLDKLVKTAESDAKIALVSPKILFASGFEFHKNRYKAGEIGSVIWYAGGEFDWHNIGNIHRGIDQVDKGQFDKVETQEIFSGACVLVKKEIFEKVGLFDEKYFLYFEDSDLAMRAKMHDFRIYYNGQVSIYHKVSRSTGIGSDLTDYFHARNRLYFGIKFASVRTKLALLREAVKLFFFGRNPQSLGVLHFFLGATGGLMQLLKNTQATYPLKLSIGIVNYNTSELTHKLLQSIFDPTSGFDPRSMEVIVLDNGNIDPSLPKIKNFLDRIKYLKNEENEGFSKGYNRTIRFAQGEYYLMLNSDIEVLAGALSKILQTAKEFKGEAVLGGQLVFPDLSEQDSAFHLPSVMGAIREYFLKMDGSYFMFRPQSDQLTRVEGLVMACFLIPQKILKKVGLVDERTFIFFEDIEYCRRLKKSSVPVYYVPDAKFVHHHGASTKKIGLDKANELLMQSAKHYHGAPYFQLLNLILRLGQKFGRVTTPVPKWAKESKT